MYLKLAYLSQIYVNTFFYKNGISSDIELAISNASLKNNFFFLTRIKLKIITTQLVCVKLVMKTHMNFGTKKEFQVNMAMMTM